MDGIHDMFAELDGYDRYESAIEEWAAIRRKNPSVRKTPVLSAEESARRRRERARIYMNNRYQNDPKFRARHIAAVKSRQRKPRVDAAIHGTVSKYNGGCRCWPCRDSIAQYKRDWRMQRAA